MLRATWTGGSLRFWVCLGIFVSIVPLMGAAIGTYLTLDRAVIVEFQDVAVRQRDQMAPLQHLQLALWEAIPPLEQHVADGDASAEPEFRAARANVESTFVALLQALATDPQGTTLVEHARADWNEVDRLAMDVLAAAPGDRTAIQTTRRVKQGIAAATDRLQAVHETLNRVIDRDHALAIRAYDRAQLIIAGAALASLVCMVLGTLIIGRVLTRSVDRLVDGAERFARGERDHRIEVQVPPELHRVAEEFNTMIVRIQESEAALARQARQDALTGAYNRRAFDETLPEWLARRQRSGEDIALLTLDIDHFKRINDSLGHGAGDEVLRAVSQELRDSIREVDRIFRIGGEEFAVLLHQCDARAAHAKAERLRANIASHALVVHGQDVLITLSIGVAMAQPGRSAESMVQAADAALYRAKALGRNRVVFETA